MAADGLGQADKMNWRLEDGLRRDARRGTGNREELEVFNISCRRRTGFTAAVGR